MPPRLPAPSLAGLANVRHGFFGRLGGVSSGIFASLNCGPGSGDAAEAVAANRARVAEGLGAAPARLLTVWQVHGAEAVAVEAPWSDAGPRPKADALVTRQKGLALGVLTADCAPVLFADAEAGVVGAAHAGWKGALAGILELTLTAMERLGARRERIAAAIGPAIGAANYEVGEAFERDFLEKDPQSGGFFHRPAGKTKPHFDLAAYCARRLTAAGAGRIEDLALCTYADPNRFFSFRRATHQGEPDYGRQISAILLA